jgi:lambda repressor-like predicted transcriptional regulator
MIELGGGVDIMEYIIGALIIVAFIGVPLAGIWYAGRYATIDKKKEQ